MDLKTRTVPALQVSGERRFQAAAARYEKHLFVAASLVKWSLPRPVARVSRCDTAERRINSARVSWGTSSPRRVLTRARPGVWATFARPGGHICAPPANSKTTQRIDKQKKTLDRS